MEGIHFWTLLFIFSIKALLLQPKAICKSSSNAVLQPIKFKMDSNSMYKYFAINHLYDFKDSMFLLNDQETNYFQPIRVSPQFLGEPRIFQTLNYHVWRHFRYSASHQQDCVQFLDAIFSTKSAVKGNLLSHQLDLYVFNKIYPLSDCSLIHLAKMDAVLTKASWNEWTIKFKTLLLEHQSVQVIHEALVELGPKIMTKLDNCRPSFCSMISARARVDLTKLFFRGGWWTTRAGGVTRGRYHWELQPYNMCPKCWIIAHNIVDCANAANDLKLIRYTNEEYIKYRHEVAKENGIEICEDLDLLIQRICEASRRNKHKHEREDSRRPKRSRSSEEENSGDQNIIEDKLLQMSKSENNDVQNTGRIPSNIEFDGMEHDLVDEREGIVKEYSHAMDESVACSTVVGNWERSASI